MRTKTQVVTTILSAAVGGIMLVPIASACGSPATLQGPFVLQQLRLDSQNPMESLSSESLVRDLSKASTTGSASIVGLWNVQFLSKGNTTHNPSIPDGAVLDFQFTQWHSDGSEFTNSGGRAPAIQNFCMGTWEQTGRYTYQLNHFAFGYDTTGTYTGKSNIIETVTLSPGGTQYSGAFTINVYDAKGNQADHIIGQITATRITVDTTP
jgi:hypothetical protein